MPLCRIHWLRSSVSACLLAASCAVSTSVAQSLADPSIDHDSKLDSSTTAAPFVSNTLKLGLPSIVRLSPLANQIDRPVITTVTLSQDHTLLAAAGDDHAVRIISTRDGKEIVVLPGHLDWVQSIAFSPDSRTVASCGKDGMIRVWSIDRSIGLIATHRVQHSLFSICFTDDNTAFAAGFSNEIYRLDIASNQIVIDHTCDCHDIRCIERSDDGSMIAYGGRDGILRWLKVGSPSTALASSQSQASSSDRPFQWSNPVHFSRIRSLHFSRDNRSIISVGEDCRLVQYNIDSRSIMHQMEVPGGKLMALCPISEGVVAVSGSDNTIRIVDVPNEIVKGRFVGHDGSIAVLCHCDNFLISGSFDTTIRSWSLDQAMTELDTRGRYVHPVAARFEDSGASEAIR